MVDRLVANIHGYPLAKRRKRTMKKIKNVFFIIFSLLMNIVLAVSLFNGFNNNYKTTEADGYHYTILDSGMFTEDVTISSKSYTFNCYRISGHDRYIAISLAKINSNNPPDDLDLSNTTITSDKPTGESLVYTIVAVARAGFAHYKFKTIKLPQTVEDIREEAFAYCQELTTFQFPKNVEIVSSSAFIDCRKLTTISYSDDEGNISYSNSKITTFGEHCFDSCVSLETIECPSSAVMFERSCFQKCSKLTVFKFPVDNGETDEDLRNIITVKEYAFADCAVLQRIYFDINMLHISDYAFADSKEELTFYFYGTEAQFPASLSAKWRNKKITTGTDTETDPENPINYNNVIYDIVYEQEKSFSAGYPGMEFTLTDKAQKLNSARTNDTTVYPIAAGGSKYAVVFSFKTPTVYKANYWTTGGILTIPDKITVDETDYFVKVIGSYAFQNNSDIKAVHFNQHLVQIQDHAFYHSNQISLLDFDSCTDLIEIGYAIFNDVQLKSEYSGQQNNVVNAMIDGTATRAVDNRNSAATHIHLPSCLQYIGNFAFYNFYSLNEEDAIKFTPSDSTPSNLKVIGDYAFAVYSDGNTNNSYGMTAAKAKTRIKLPYSLSDEAAKDANYFHSFTYDDIRPKIVNDSIFNRYAVNKNAFENQDSIVSVEMLSGGTAHDISFGSNAFVRCSYLARFQSTDNICLIGNDAFKMCNSLKEVFLSADRAYNNTSATYTSGVNMGKPNGQKISNPWGVKDGDNSRLRDIFVNTSNSVYPDLVIYVKSSSQATYYPNYDATWYATPNAYNNAYTGTNRSTIPVYYGDWSASGTIKYWHIKDGDGGSKPSANALLDFNDGPKVLNDYNDGYVTLFKNTSSPSAKYTVARYYTDGGNYHYAATLDFSASPINSLTITTIGAEAFASNDDIVLGYYFVLQSTVTTINERAFFRKSPGKGVRIVTFHNGTDIQTYNGCPNQFSAVVSGYSDGDGYCCLPNGVTQINNSVFYNNAFAYVELSKDISYLTNTAFYTHIASSANQGKIVSYAFTDYNSNTSPDTNTNFSVINGDIYYTKDSSSNKVLYQARTGETGTLTIDSNTKGIYYNAAAGSKFSGVDFGSAYTIYGKAFINCYSLATLSNTSSVKYICYTPDSSESITVDTNIAKSESTSNESAFQGCSNLKVDFTEEFLNIKKIGTKSFFDCANIVNLTSRTKTYAIYKYAQGNSDDGSVVASNAAKVLDLSRLADFTNINANAFAGSCSVNYVILPNTTNTTYNLESKFFVSSTTPFTSGSIKLCGETIDQADANRYSGTTANVNNPHVPYLTAKQITNHYPDKAINSDYSKLYFRIHTVDDIWDGAPSTRCYWTAIDTNDADEVKIVLFDTGAAAKEWLNKQDSNDNYVNLNRQLHTFITHN